MPMLDSGIKIEVSKDIAITGTTIKPLSEVTEWTVLKDCTAMPALMQPSSKISTDYIGDDFTSEMLGKKVITGLDFTFAYDGGKEGCQFRMLADYDDNNERHWLRVTYPDGTSFSMIVDFEVTLVPPTASGEIDFTVSVTPSRNGTSSMIIISYPS